MECLFVWAFSMVLTGVLKASGTKQGGMMCMVSPHLNGPTLPETTAGVSVKVSTLIPSLGKTSHADF